MILTAALTLTPALAAASPKVPPVPEDWVNSFPDVEEIAWYYPYVADLARRGLIRGYDSGLFGPLDEVRAGDAIILVVRTAGGGDPESPKGTHYAQGYVDYALEQGWMEQGEVPENLNTSGTRLFVARLAARALSIPPAEGSPFADTEDPLVTGLFLAGIVEGTFDGEGRQIFAPDTPISRSELAAFVWRILDWMENQEAKPEEPEEPEDPDVSGQPETPGDPEDPELSAGPGGPEAPDIPEVSDPPKGPDVLESQSVPETPDASEDPNLPEESDPQEDLPEGSDPQEDPALPENPVNPQTPVTPQPPQQIPLGNNMVDVVPDVPVSPWNPESFSLVNGRMVCSMEGVKTSLGVDVSSHQGVINWNKVADAGVEFAIIRAGGRYYGVNSGTIFADARFQSNLKGAMAAGLETGVYFFSQAISVEEAREEARFVLDQIRDTPFHGPVVFDWENIGTDKARTDHMTAPQVTAAALAFCQMVEEAGYQPMIYFNRYIAYELYQLDQVQQYPFWVADFNSQPRFYYEYTVWQYSDKGRISGIPEAVDLNISLSWEK